MLKNMSTSRYENLMKVQVEYIAMKHGLKQL